MLLAVLIALCLFCPALAFTKTVPTFVASVKKSHSISIPKQQRKQQGLYLQPTPSTNNDDTSSESETFPKKRTSPATTLIMKAAVVITTASPLLLFFPLVALAAEQQQVVQGEYEAVGLPPPYVPALFGVALLGGVALLTGSLGNVMDEEALLGMQSGARAKKEIERSRSSYFKKK